MTDSCILCGAERDIQSEYCRQCWVNKRILHLQGEHDKPLSDMAKEAYR